MTVHEDLRLLATAVRTRMAATDNEAYELACATLTLLERVERLTVECSCAHRHYVEATHGEWRHKARADDAEARLWAARLVQSWTNEDGRKFVFADDLLAAIDPELAKQVAMAKQSAVA